MRCYIFFFTSLELIWIHQALLRTYLIDVNVTRLASDYY